MNRRIQALRVEELSPEERDQVETWTQLVFGPQPYVIAEMEWCVLLWIGQRLVSHVGIVRRTVDVEGLPVDVGGIGWVGTLPDERSRGLGAAAMQRAADVLRDDLRVEFGLLVCGDHTVGFYHTLGWQRVQSPVVFDQPTGKVTWPGAAMVLPRAQATWPIGTVDLCGLLW